MNKLFSLKLWQQLVLGFGLLTLMVIGLGGFLQQELEWANQSYQRTISQDVMMERLVRQLAEFMLQARRTEKDFLLRLDRAYVEKHQAILHEFLAMSEKLIQLEQENGHQEDMARVRGLQQKMTAYQTAFSQVVQGWHEKGLSEKEGLQREFREAAHALAELFKNLDTEEIALTLGELRRREKDFVSRGDDASVKKWTQAGEKFTAHLADSELPEPLQKQITAAFTPYAEAVRRYIARRQAGEVVELQDPGYLAISETAHVLEKWILSHTIEKASRLLLEVRKHEKDYLLRKDRKYVDQVKKTIARILTHTMGSQVNADMKDQIVKLSGRYEQSFYALVLKDEALNTATATMRQTVQEVEKSLADYLGATIEETQEKVSLVSQQIERAIFQARVAQAGAILCFILIAVLIGKGIFKVVGGEPQEILGILAHMASGHLTVQARGGETGIFAQVMKLAGDLGRTVRMVKLQVATVQASTEQLREILKGVSQDADNSRQHIRQVVAKNDAIDSKTNDLVSLMEMASEAVEAMAAAADQLSANICTIATGAEQASQNMTTVAASAEEVSSNVAGVNRNLQQVNQSVVSVSAAVEELTASLGEVLGQCRIASNEAGSASRTTETARELIAHLDQAAGEIGKVTALIQHIASQTNLLALNAAIEAAGAGEAGKGFAVVANEVKELARQTADATRQIGGQIHNIQNIASQVVTAVDHVTQSVRDVAQGNLAITHAVEEQQLTVAEIARAAAAVALAAQQVTHAATEMEQAAMESARAASEADLGIQEIARAAGGGATLAKQVAKQARGARDRVDQVVTGLHDIAFESSEAQGLALRTSESADHVQGSVYQADRLSDVADQSVGSLHESQHGFQVGQPPFEVGAIKQAHLAWMAKLENMLRGRLHMTPDQAGTGHDSDFVAWYELHGKQQFGHLPVFGQIGEVHLAIHAKAREIVDLYHGKKDRQGSQQPNPEMAKARMSEFNDLRRELFRYLDQLYLETAWNVEQQATA